jgi:3-hydroxyacyl-[acyl-carrier protein] dehydratase/trans-2-decenoyl-[acyl-carrier protein] isomerase
LEALWQLAGFYLGWLGVPGRGRALGVREVKFTGMITPKIAAIEYVVDIKRVFMRRLKLVIADGVVKADGEVIYAATDLTVGLTEIGGIGEAGLTPAETTSRTGRRSTLGGRSEEFAMDRDARTVQGVSA